MKYFMQEEKEEKEKKLGKYFTQEEKEEKENAVTKNLQMKCWNSAR